jgi:type 1 glutamine amidotransferase
MKRRLRSGILALQLHAGPPMKVQFRNIRLKRLKLGDRKKLVLVAGRRSHGYGAHEHNAGCLLLKKALDENLPAVFSTVYRGGWPKDPTAFDNADGIVLYMDGGGGHPVNQHLTELDAVMKKGVGLACLHYGVEVPKGKSGDAFLDWIGGYFEAFWSVNPHWTIRKPTLAKDHPISRGVKPFEVNDEWYYHMRFRPNMDGVTAILTATPPASTLSRPDGAHSGNKFVRARKGMPEVLAWAAERPGGGRGFGFTGGHHHNNWQNDDFRKLVLNALVWITGATVPEGGVGSTTPTQADLEANQDFEKKQDRRKRRRG